MSRMSETTNARDCSQAANHLARCPLSPHSAITISNSRCITTCAELPWNSSLAQTLRTAIAPTWSEIGQLAVIATIRTALNFFLQQEIDKATARRAAPEQARSALSDIR